MLAHINPSKDIITLQNLIPMSSTPSQCEIDMLSVWGKAVGWEMKPPLLPKACQFSWYGLNPFWLYDCIGSGIIPGIAHLYSIDLGEAPRSSLLGTLVARP